MRSMAAGVRVRAALEGRSFIDSIPTSLSIVSLPLPRFALSGPPTSQTNDQSDSRKWETQNNRILPVPTRIISSKTSFPLPNESPPPSPTSLASASFLP